MYDRQYDDKELSFEPSGGLMHASLVMQDKETDSYWSIMTADSIGGDLKGEKLRELPGTAKVQWRDWVTQHPDTLILSVDGKQHIENNPYDNYFSSEDGYRDFQAVDGRLSTKTPVYSFQRNCVKYAVPFEFYEGQGQSFDLRDGQKIFLFRPGEVAIFYSTIAFITDGPGFEFKNSKWIETGSGATFDPEIEAFIGAAAPVERLDGFDTFWYNWSLTHPDTEILGKDESGS